MFCVCFLSMLWKEETSGSGEGRSDTQDISEVVDSLI